MRKFIPLFMILVLLGTASCGKQEPTLEELYPEQNTQPRPGQIKAMTFNIRQNNDNDGAFNHWALRAGACRTMVEVQKPTILGLQELSETQLEYMTLTLSKKGYVTVTEKEYLNSFMYNPDVLDVEDTGMFYLNDTPEVYSISWDGYMRYVAWAVMYIKATGVRFFFMNTHLGLSAFSRTKAMALIGQRLKVLNSENLPVIFMADFNGNATESCFDAIRKTMVCTREVAPITDEIKTYNGWNNLEKNTPYVCDHIWISNTLVCPEYRTVTVPYEGHTYISDHFPVYSIIQF